MASKPTLKEKNEASRKKAEAEKFASAQTRESLSLTKRVLMACATEYLFLIGTIFLVFTWIIQTFKISDLEKSLKYLDIQFANWTNISHHQQTMQNQMFDFKLNRDKYLTLGPDGDSLYWSHEMSREVSYCSGAMLQMENMYLYSFGEDSLQSIMNRKQVQYNKLRAIINKANPGDGLYEYFQLKANEIRALTVSIENEITTSHESLIYKGNERTKLLENNKDIWEGVALATLIIGTLLINLNLVKKALKNQVPPTIKKTGDIPITT